MDRSEQQTQHEAEFRFYEELNDFLPAEWRKRAFTHSFRGTPSVKDVVEALGVPHTEVDLILVDGRPVRFDHLLRGEERVAVYPVFEALELGSVYRLRPQPLRRTRFVLDVHLGKLARYLRLLGFDALYRNDFDDPDLVAVASAQQRIILTRDKGILKRGAVTHGYWVRATDPRAQLREVLGAFDLSSRVAPFTRCMHCNGALAPVTKTAVWDQLPPAVREAYDEFVRCAACARVYWPGTHYERMKRLLLQVLQQQERTG